VPGRDRGDGWMRASFVEWERGMRTFFCHGEGCGGELRRGL
jgi:hypothetical protein